MTSGGVSRAVAGLFVAVGAAALLATGLGAGAADPDARARLGEIRKQIEEREQRARDLATQAETALGELEAIDRQLHETRASMKLLQRREREAEEELEAARGRLARAERSHARTLLEVHQRLIALYKFQAVNAAPPIARARDFQQALHVGQGLGRVLEADARLFERFARSREEFEASHARAESLKGEIAGARREVERRRARVSRMAVERRNLVALLNSRADRERRGAAELRAAAERLEAVIQSLPRGSGPRPGAGLRKGALTGPVQGPLRLGFGRQVDPEFGTETLRNGIEISASRGDDVRAVGEGRVLFAGWFQGYGQVVIVDHGEETITVSGFLDELAVDKEDAVAAGQVIGWVGETGSLAGPGLYFEVRVDGRPVDPAEWLE